MYTYDVVIKGLKQGRRFARSSWNGKDMFIFLVAPSTFTVNREPLLSILGAGTFVAYCGHIDMRCADGTITAWTPSHADQLADDWYEVTP